VLRVVLSHSREGYSEAVYRQTTDNLIGVLETRGFTAPPEAADVTS
jgi:hypothetical protein